MQDVSKDGVVVTDADSSVVEAGNPHPVPEAPSGGYTADGKTQFGRFVYVEILDFKSGNKTTVGNVFEIEFSFMKTIDHVKGDDMGKIRIHGLTKERIKSFQSSGGEVRVYAGYLYSEIKPVFVGRIVRLYGEITNGSTVMTIECSANMLNHYVTGVVLGDGSNITSVGKFMDNIAKVSGYPKAVFDLKDVPSNEIVKVKEFIIEHLAPNTLVGDVFTLSQKAAAMFGFEIMATESDGVKVFLVRVGDRALKTIRELTAKGYPKGVFNNSSIEDALEFTMAVPSEVRNAVVLNHKTGLISSSIEYKITKAFADQELGSNEEETSESQADRAAQMKKFEESEAKRKEEAAKKGKVFKPKSPPKSLTEKYVNRKYNKVRALFNPSVRPQGLVVVYDSFEDEYAVYRVRTMNISCNNKKGDWVMDLSCEDSRNLALTAEQVRQIESMEESELVVSAPEQPSAQPSGSNSSRRDAVMRFFMSKGWTKNQAAGITANLQVESHNVKAQIMFDNTVVGDGGQAYGLAQWHPPRQEDFRDAFGKSIKGSSLQEQLEFVQFELTQGKETNAGNRLRATSSAYQAGSVVSQWYERPKDVEGQKRLRGNLAESIAKLY